MRQAAPREGAGWLRSIAPLTLAVLAGPVVAGLAGVVLPAFGYMPALGGAGFSLEPWRELLAWPGLAAAVRLSLTTGIGATVIALALTLLLVAAGQGTRTFRVLVRLIAPVLSVPHAATAFGLAFLIAPSGWIARLLSPWMTGWERPPDLLTVNDPAGLALTLGLVLKELPFLMLMTLAALAQADGLRTREVAETLGYGRIAAWMLVVLPRVYAQIRLPVYAVLAYSMSVVDMALILGPTRPGPLAVVILDWMSDPDLSMRFRAAAAALLLLALVAGALVLWRLAEEGAGALCRLVAMRGMRATALDRPLRPLALGLGAVSAALVLAGLAGLAVWSVAALWRFPDALPAGLTLRIWQAQGTAIAGAAGITALIGVIATVAALVLVLGWLEAAHRAGRRAPAPAVLPLIYLPLIVPQVVFLPGMQVLALMAGFEGGLVLVMAVHLIFVLPYVFLSLADPWQAWDARAGTVAASLGAGPWRILLTVRLPMLLRPVLTAAAVGFAVSVAQYLPTLLIGAGRVATLTTEAVALAAGGNRRVIGAWALAQMLAPFAGFALALVVPALAFRKRKGMAV